MIKCICFDVDDTLLDFHAGEVIAFQQAMNHIGFNSSEADYLLYEEINSNLWKDFELEKITKDKLRVQRFIDFFHKKKIDFNAEKMSDIYLDKLSKQAILIENAKEVVEKCTKLVPCAVATNGIAAVQRSRLKKSGLMPYFQYLFISEEMNAVKPQFAFFNEIFKTINCQPDEILFVGDSLSADIKGAVNSGCISVWYNPKQLENKFDFKADYEIQNIAEVLKIMEAQ